MAPAGGIRVPPGTCSGNIFVSFDIIGHFIFSSLKKYEVC